jgi:hypothetical protein
VRVKRLDEHNRVALTVIYLLGAVAIIAAGWTGFLVHESVVSDNAIDSAAVALIGQMASIATLSIGALGAMLSSTSPKPPPPPTVTDSSGQPSTPVTVVNQPANPVPTDPHPEVPPAGGMADPDGADPGVLDPAP